MRVAKETHKFLIGGARHHASSTRFWRTMTFPERRLFLSVLPAAVEWVPVRPIWSSLRAMHSGLTIMSQRGQKEKYAGAVILQN